MKSCSSVCKSRSTVLSGGLSLGASGLQRLRNRQSFWGAQCYCGLASIVPCKYFGHVLNHALYTLI